MAPTSLLLLLLLLACAAPLPLQLRAADTPTIRLYMHDVVSGSGATAVQVIKGPASSSGNGGVSTGFGDTTVIDDALTETSSPTSREVGRAQGFYMVASQSSPALMMCINLYFTSGDNNGSTIAVMGHDDTAAAVRELSVVGGTGKFRMATGYVVWKTATMTPSDGVFELDVYVTTPNGTTIDASAPVSPLDGGGGSSGGGSSTAKSGAAAPGRMRGWVNACVVGLVVVVLLVGRGW
ncbi:dirigent protein 1-like [Oryza brachyantha]|uniref:dirigent protein 1-like n=1 Tax=Oryza brachyantha TaxID=4533 RepID=UPI001AD9DC22|nr:dirigent protein 1-like [Oryza brachyantha]